MGTLQTHTMKQKAIFVAVVVVASFLAASGQQLKTAEDYNNRGLEKQGKGDLDGAIEDYTAALAMKARPSTLAAAYNNRANARTSKNDLAGAVADYSKAIELEPANEENYYNRGVVLLSVGETDRAITDVTKAI